MIEELKTQRFRLLNVLYNWCEGDTRKWIDLKELCNLRSIPFADKAYHYLENEGLIAYYCSGYTCYLTHKGVKAIEDAWNDVNQSSYYFPPVARIMPPNGTI